MKSIHFLLILLFGIMGQVYAQQTVIFEDNFDFGIFNPNWVVTPGAVNPFLSVVQEVNGLVAYKSSPFGVAMGKSSDAGDNNLNTLDITLDLSQYNNVDLSFWFYHFFDEEHVQDGIYLSNDGSTFLPIFQFRNSYWCNTSQVAYGQLPPIDIDRHVKEFGWSLNDPITIRFQQYDNKDFQSGSFDAEDGIFIDDVLITAPTITYETLPFFEDFEIGSLSSAWRWGNAFFPSKTGPVGENTITPGGIVSVLQEIENINANYTQNGHYGVVLGRDRNDCNFTTNALDLHLDLSGAETVVLDFAIKHNLDETHVYDGIYLSDDGGETFFPAAVYSFNPSGWSSTWGKLPPIDIASRALERGLMLSDSFVIRFQQYDNNDFALGPFDAEDGIIFDDISVTSPNTTYVDTFPYCENFESGTFSSEWKWADPTYPSLTTEPGSVRPGGLIEVVQEIAGQSASYEGNYGVAMGRRNDGNFTTNALDLHLNLSNSGIEDAVLSFWIKNYFDEEHAEDAVLFSDDGGESFRTVYPFTSVNLPVNQFVKINIDIDSVITADPLLDFSDQFVIRFQQYDDKGFSAGPFDAEDGFFLDLICVDVLTGIEYDAIGDIPLDFHLQQNYPNPFNPTTTVEYALPKAEKVHLTVFNMLGQEVATLVNGEAMQAGVHSATFNAENLPSGVYYYRINAGDFSETKKMLLVR